MGTYDANDLRGLGRMFMRSYGDGVDTMFAPRARPALTDVQFVPPTVVSDPSPTPYTPAPTPPVKAATPVVQTSDTATVRSLEEQLKRTRASEQALTKIIREAQQEPAPGVQPSGLQLAFRQARNTIAALNKQVADLTNQLQKTRASEQALTKIIREAQQEPAAGVQPSGLQLAFRQARQRIAQLEAQLRGGT